MIDTAYFQPTDTKCPVCGSFGTIEDEFMACPLCETKFTEYAVLELGHKKFAVGNN